MTRKEQKNLWVKLVRGLPASQFLFYGNFPVFTCRSLEVSFTYVNETALRCFLGEGVKITSENHSSYITYKFS